MANARFQKIIDDGLCIGCGLCASIAGNGKINMEISKDFELRPQVNGELSESLVDKIYQTCPGTRVEGLPQKLLDQAENHDPVWGPYQDLVLAWAADPKVRFEGATGGVLTALGMFLVESERVKFVLHVGPSESVPTQGQHVLSHSAEAVLSNAGSRYGPTAMLKDIDDILALEKPFAIIGKPCDVSALRNLAKIDARVNELVKYWLTPVCGGFMPGQSMQDFLSKSQINANDIRAFNYRGKGCPGPTTAHFRNGTRRDWHYLDFWGEDESAWSLPFRCKICPDGIGESADIAAADTWPNASPNRELSRTDPGTNSVIIRSWAGMELMAAAIHAGYLKVGKPVSPDYLSSTQPHQVTKKNTMGARYAGIKAAGKLVPETTGLRLETLSKGLSKSEYQDQKNGAYRRAIKINTSDKTRR